jgi:DNA gyrase subunit A
MAIRFSEADARPMGRTAHGVRGMQLREGDEVVGMSVMTADSSLLTVCEHGYGKRTEAEEYRRQTRGGIGLKDIAASKRNGPVVGIACVTERHQLLLVTEQGQIIRMSAGDIRPIGRDTQGVKLIDLAEGDRLVTLATILEVEDPEPAG